MKTFDLHFKYLLVLTLGMTILVGGCGKKAKTDNESSAPEESERLPQQDINAYLSKQDISCEPNQACPQFIAKIVIVHGNQYKYCTGFLTNDDIVVTSSSCLPHLLRLNGQNCSRDVFLFFPRSGNQPAVRVGCNEVVLASNIEGEDALLWRDDVAFLKISESLRFRRKVRVSREGMSNRREFMTWMIDQQGDYSAIIKRSTCEAVHNTYVNPLVQTESSPGMVFANCALTKGGAGAPVIDSRGKVRGILSKTIDKKVRNYLESTGLLEDGLSPMNHGTNFACAPTPYNNDTLDERECLKDLTYAKVDRLRSDMLSTELLFDEMKKKLESSLSRASRYINLGVKMISKGDIQEAQVYPKCFKPFKSWLDSLNNTRNTFVEDVKIPVRSFRRVMDSVGRVVGKSVDAGQKETYLQFSLKALRSSKISSILMWSPNEELQTFPQMTDGCDL